MDSLSPFLIKADKGFTILYKNKHLYSASNPVKSACNRINTILINNKTLVFIPSPLLFYGFDILLKMLPTDSHILCIEADEKLMALSLNNTDKQYFKNPSITYMRTDSPDSINKIIEKIGVWKYRRVIMPVLSGGYYIYADIYKKMFKTIENAIQTYWQNKMTLIHMADLWIKNIFNNLASCNTTSSLTNFNTDKPVLVTGAGESLEKSLNLIKKVRDKIFIVAVDTALPVLFQSGITPDLIMIIESQYSNSLDFLNYKNSTIPIACDLSSFPGVIKLFKGRVYLFLSYFTHCNLFYRMKNTGLMPMQLPPLGSVGVAAVEIALNITNFPVLLTGLDFSYNIGKSHARGAPSHQMDLFQTYRFKPSGTFNKCMQRPLLKVKNKYGEYINSDIVLNSYCNTLKNMLSKNSRVFDIGHSGLFTGAKIVHDENKILEILKTDTAISKKPFRAPDKLNTNPQNALSFFETEKQILLNLITNGKEYIIKNRSNELEKKLLDLLTISDYIYLAFPDPPPLPSSDISFIKRSIASAERYLILIEKSLRIIHGKL